MNIEEIYLQHKNQVFNLCLHYLQNREDAEEATQDVFVAIHHSMHKFEGKANLSTWIYRITVNKCLDLIKARKRKKRFAILMSFFSKDNGQLVYEPPEFNHPGVVLEQKETMKKIFDLVNELPANQKTALILTKIEEKSQQEVATIMELSVKAVESLVQRAKTTLQKKLSKSEG